MEHAVSSEGEGVWLWVGGYLYLARSVSRTPKPPGIRQLSAPMGGEVVGGRCGGQMQPLTSPASAVTHFYFGMEVERLVAGEGWGGAVS